LDLELNQLREKLLKAHESNRVSSAQEQHNQRQVSVLQLYQDKISKTTAEPLVETLQSVITQARELGKFARPLQKSSTILHNKTII